MSQEQRPLNAIISQKEGVSAVWLVPVIALLFGTWLIVKAIYERGVYITVQFDNASGIVVGKTEVRYKGLPVGVVRHVEVADDLQSLMATIEMVASSEALLKDSTEFWYVTADVSLQGVTGLDTLLSGSYINVQPDLDNTGEPARYFIALSEAPELDSAAPGLHIILKTNTLGSVNKGSPVSFKQIPVGYVSGVQYNVDDSTVDITVFIKPEHAHLVKENSIFWNASGIELTGSLTSGFKVKTESVGSIISGGIAFDDPKYSTPLPAAKSGDSFTLHPDFQTAEMGHSVTLILDWDAGIDRGALIQYQGLTLGVVDTFSKIDPHNRKLTAIAKVSPRVVPYLTSDTQFYIVKPELDLGGVTNLRTLFTGAHLSLKPSLKGEQQSEFHVFSHKPAYNYDEPGLHLVLTANNVESLKVGANIYFKKQVVGSIQAIENKTSEQVLVHIHIEDKYKQYVSDQTRFYNTSGLKVSAGVNGISLQAHSLQSILAGGIAFTTPNSNNYAVNNGDVFTLFKNKNIAKQSVEVILTATDLKAIKPATRVFHRGEEIGSVHRIKHHGDTHKITLGLLPEFSYLLKQTSNFWLVTPTLTLSGVTDTNALLGGSYIAVDAGIGKEKNQFHLLYDPPAKATHHAGLQLTLMTSEGANLTAGNPIIYKGITLGQIDSIGLSNKGEYTKVNITIDDNYRHLVNRFTRFYLANGISLNTGLAGITVQAETVDTILRGGISFFNPEPKASQLSSEGDTFTLFANEKAAVSAGIAIQIHFTNTDGIKPGLNIRYHQQKIGIINHVNINPHDHSVTAYGYLNDYGKQFAVKDSVFYYQAARIGLVGNTNLQEALNGGFIGVSPGQGAVNTEFQAANTPPAITELPYGLNLTLSATSLGSIRIDNPVLYKQVEVGKVIGVDLAPTGDSVNIYINIAKKYAPLVTNDSKFWNTSGFTVEAGVFSGVNVESESLETLLAGGIAFATPKAMVENQTKQHQVFNLAEKVKPEWQTWSPKISLHLP